MVYKIFQSVKLTIVLSKVRRLYLLFVLFSLVSCYKSAIKDNVYVFKSSRRASLLFCLLGKRPTLPPPHNRNTDGANGAYAQQICAATQQEAPEGCVAGAKRREYY